VCTLIGCVTPAPSEQKYPVLSSGEMELGTLVSHKGSAVGGFIMFSHLCQRSNGLMASHCVRCPPAVIRSSNSSHISETLHDLFFIIWHIHNISALPLCTSMAQKPVPFQFELTFPLILHRHISVKW